MRTIELIIDQLDMLIFGFLLTFMFVKMLTELGVSEWMEEVSKEQKRESVKYVILVIDQFMTCYYCFGFWIMFLMGTIRLGIDDGIMMAMLLSFLMYLFKVLIAMINRIGND